MGDEGDNWMDWGSGISILGIELDVDDAGEGRYTGYV